MSLLRFYVRNADGSAQGDETCLIETRDVESLEKDFTVFGQRKTFVVEFDPPLLVPKPVEQGDAK